MFQTNSKRGIINPPYLIVYLIVNKKVPVYSRLPNHKVLEETFKSKLLKTRN